MNIKINHKRAADQELSIFNISSFWSETYKNLNRFFLQSVYFFIVA